MVVVVVAAGVVVVAEIVVVAVVALGVGRPQKARPSLGWQQREGEGQQPPRLRSELKLKLPNSDFSSRRSDHELRSEVADEQFWRPGFQF